MTISSRVMSVQLGSNLKGGLDMLVVVFDKQHWVVFEDGSVEQLMYFKNNDREEWVISPPVVKDEVILQTRLVQTSPHGVPPSQGHQHIQPGGGDGPCGAGQ